MPQQVRDALYGVVARGRILAHDINASYSQNPPHYAGSHLNQAVVFNEMFVLQQLARNPYEVTPIRSSRQIGNVNFSTQIISEHAFPESLSEDWVGSQSPGDATTGADCAILVASVQWPSTTYKSRLGAANYVELLTGLYVPLMQYRHTQAHRVDLSEASVSYPGIGVAVGKGFYNGGATSSSPPENVALQAISDLVLPYNLTYAGNFGGWELVRHPSVVSLIAKDDSGTALVIDEVFTFVSPLIVSAIALDPRSGEEWLTAASIGITNTGAYADSHLSLARDVTRYPLFPSTGPNPLFSYLQCSILSSPVEQSTAGNYNVFDGGTSYGIHMARRGASVGGNTAMPLDYDTWDFAAVCKREFYSLAVPAQSTVAGAPESHQSFDSPEFFRLYEPSPLNIGSPMSLLAERETNATSFEKPYYHQLEGSAVPDLRSADFSLVMLKGMSLIYQNGAFASDESSLAPILPTQSAFRFKSHDISGTTVRFDPVAWTDGTSFGATPEPMPAAESLAPQQETFTVTTTLFGVFQPPDLSGDYWVETTTSLFNGPFFRPGGLAYTVFSDFYYVPQTSGRALYKAEYYVPPARNQVNPLWLSTYANTQSFAAGQQWDEVSYNAGLYAETFLDAQVNTSSSTGLAVLTGPAFPGATQGARSELRYPIVLVQGGSGGVYSFPASLAQPQDPLTVPAAIAMPMICGQEFSCDRRDIAGVQPAAGLFSYSGAGPSETVSVPVHARGAKVTYTPQQQPYDTQGNTLFFYNDITREPYEIPGVITVAMDTPEVNLFVRWHASLQGLGAYKPGGLSAHLPNGIDIDDQRGSVSPFHWVRSSRINELSPVLIAELWMTARSTADVSVEWQWPEEFPELMSAFPARANYGPLGNTSTADVSEFNVFAGGLYGTLSSAYNVPVPLARHQSQGAFLHDKSPFLAGRFVFNREQTARLLNGESVYPTRWMEYEEGDPAGEEPQLLKWHQAEPATVRPSFTLQFT